MSPMPSQSKSKFDLIRKLRKQRCLKRRTKDTTITLKTINSNPTPRQVGKRIYDSVLGVTCHWCRQKTVETHVKCCKCLIQFCGACLLNRNGEIIADEVLHEVKWTCPKCRGGCGDYCSNCCNCGRCRKDQGLEPTGQLKETARRAGFSNAHDYLIYLKTNEPQEVIALRKENRGWTKDTGGLRLLAGHENDSGTPNIGVNNFIDLTQCDGAKQEDSGSRPSMPRYIDLTGKNSSQSQSSRTETKNSHTVTCNSPSKVTYEEEKAGSQSHHIRDTKDKSGKPKKDVIQFTLSEALHCRRVQGRQNSSPVPSNAGSSPVPSQISSSPGRTHKSSSPEQTQKSSSSELIQRGSSRQKKHPIQSTGSQESLKIPRHTTVLENTTVLERTSLIRNRLRSSQVKAKSLQDLSFIEEEHNAYTGPYDFEEKLQAMNTKPFSYDRLQVLIRAMSRPSKKIARTRETRSRSIEVSSPETGESYLDRHSDIQELLSNISDPREKWKLLRSFFFWISHSCMDGAYKPWTKNNNSDDCCLIPKPYSQIDLIDLSNQDDEILSSTPTSPSSTNVSKSYFDSAKVKKEKA